MTLTEFLVMKSSVESGQCKSDGYKAAKETAKEVKFSSEEESTERARRAADCTEALHERIVEATWETFKDKVDKIPTDVNDVDKQVEELFKGLMSTAIKSASLGLIAQLLQ